ncbi:hypothetical protein WDW89_24695 [Deltaproteobacteria bacterium TL4]
MKKETVPIIKTRNPSEQTLRVVSTDPVVALIFCDSVQKTSFFPKVYCSSTDTVDTDYTLQIEPAIHEPSSDFLRNVFYSVATFTTIVLVSSSGTMEYHLSLSHRDQIPQEVTFKNEGRIGVWCVQGPILGTLGTIVGTMINGDKRPDYLQQECLQPNYAEAKEACTFYNDFIQDSVAKLWIQIWSTIQTTVVALEGEKS